eukprot:COSAG04_NODE_120_length_24916_cov_9.576218_11_plen_293_part_00
MNWASVNVEDTGPAQRHRCHLEKNATQITAISWRLTLHALLAPCHAADVPFLRVHVRLALVSIGAVGAGARRAPLAAVGQPQAIVLKEERVDPVDADLNAEAARGAGAPDAWGAGRRGGRAGDLAQREEAVLAEAAVQVLVGGLSALAGVGLSVGVIPIAVSCERGEEHQHDLVLQRGSVEAVRFARTPVDEVDRAAVVPDKAALPFLVIEPAAVVMLLGLARRTARRIEKASHFTSSIPSSCPRHRSGRRTGGRPWRPGPARRTSGSRRCPRNAARNTPRRRADPWPRRPR